MLLMFIPINTFSLSASSVTVMDMDTKRALNCVKYANQEHIQKEEEVNATCV